jgi:hypothetical protein
MQQKTTAGDSIEKLAESYIKPNDLLTSFERLEIYNRQYWFRVIGAVSEDFPALAAVLGSKRFDDLVLAYLKENPSTSFTLRDLGARLPSWLADHPEFAPTRHALLLDVARLEWAYVEAFDRFAAPPLMQADFADLGADSKLALQPHIQLLDLRYPVDELVLAVHKETPPSDIMSNAVSERRTKSRVKLPRLRRAATYLAVHRFDNSVYYRRIDRETFQLLSALQRKHTLSQAIDMAFMDSKLPPEEQAQKIQECFAHAAELGWFCQQHTNLAGLQ